MPAVPRRAGSSLFEPASRHACWWACDARWPRTPRAATGTVLLTASLIPVAPTILVGLRTWHVTASQRALLSAVSSTKGPPGMVATIPFEQDYRYVTQGTYQGYEHDLGYESTLFTGRGAVGDGELELSDPRTSSRTPPACSQG